LRSPYGARNFSTIAVLDARRVVVDEHVRRASLLEVSLTGMGGDQETRALTRGQGRDRQPAYSPDGTRILFSSNRSGNVDLWIAERATGALRQLTDDPADDWDPAFTPDGEGVLWSSNRGGNMEVWMAAADGSRARQVTRDGVDAENPTMTADGEWIVHSSANDEKLGIWRIRADGSDPALIAPGSNVLPEVSPDGRHALYVGRRGTRTAIRVVEVESGEAVPFEIEVPRTLDLINVQMGRGRWTPDGRAIVFVAVNADGLDGLFVQDFVPGQDTSRTRRPLAGFTEEYGTESFDVSPDGAGVVISAMVDQRTLRLVENVPLSGWQ
jgi:Tol biopolymer transport system component